MARPAKRTPAVAAWIETNPLRVWRTDRGMTIAYAAKLLGVTTVAIGHWETGIRLPSPVTRRRLRRHLTETGARDVWDSLPLAALDAWHTHRPEET